MQTLIRRSFVCVLWLTLGCGRSGFERFELPVFDSDPDPSDTDLGDPSPSDPSAQTFVLGLSGPVTGSAGYCYAYTVTLRDGLGASSAAGADTQIALTAGSSALFAATDCSASSTNTVTVIAGASSVTFGLRSPSAAGFTISASHPTSTPASLDVSMTGAVADLVLGAPNALTNLGLQRGLSTSINDVALIGGKLYIADGGNHRILIYDTIPTTNHAAADHVIGQRDLAANVANAFGADARSLLTPTCVYGDGTRLFVCDTGNNRVLIYNTPPTSDGVAADLVLGQPDFASSQANQGGSPSASTLAGPWQVTSLGGKVIIVDNGNRRALVFNTVPVANGAAADVVIGQPDFSTAVANYPSGTPAANTLGPEPRGVGNDGTRLYIADYLNHRMLIWNAVPTTNFANADLELGQADFTSNTPNSGGVSAASFSSLNSTRSDGTHVVAADYQNSRVLIWNSLPTAMRQAADVVVGQPDMSSNAPNNGGIGPARMFRPYSADTDGVHLVVTDYQNNRVLIWNTLPTASSTPADVVVGQSDFVKTIWESTGASARTLQWPRGVHCDGTKLYVADYLNWRTLIWNTLPTRSFQAADVVLSQPDFTTTILGYPDGTTVTAANSRKANYIWRAGTRLYEADHDNNRVLVWNTVPTVNNAPGDFALGQPDLVTGTQNTGGVSATSMKRPEGVMEDAQGRVLVADSENNRVLIWSTRPTSSGVPADLVLGQPNFNSTGGAATASGFVFPMMAFSVAGRVLVADVRRVLIWNSFPTVNGQPADLVLGQPDMVSITPNGNGLNASSVAGVSEVWSDGVRVIAADAGNNRILVWFTFPTANAQPADYVLGQPDMFSGAENPGGISARGFRDPRNFSVVGDTIWVSEDLNNRVLHFTLPTR